MHSPLTITVKVLRIAVVVAELRGVPAELLLGPLGIDARALEDTDAHVPFAWMEHVWAEAPRLTRDGAFGIHAAEALAGKPGHMLDYLAAYCRTPRAIIELLQRYQPTLMNRASIELVTAQPRATLILHAIEGGITRPAQMSEFVIAQWALKLRERCPRPFDLRRVSFMHKRPADTAEHERVFKAPIEFGAAHDAIEFDAAQLDIELTGSDETLVRFLRGHADALLSKLAAADDRRALAARTREALLRAPPGELPGVDRVAREVGLSERTLQRKLRDEGTSFKDVLDDVRRALALAYLSDPRHSISDVAFLVGFSEISAFSRAFRRWTSESPLAWRRSARAAPPVKPLAAAVKT